MVDTASLNIPGYRITRLLGQGGMAAVYLAIQESFERDVALKVLSPAMAVDEGFTERFIREAKIVSRLVHPNIVTVYDVGVADDHYYLSMEYVPGQDLKQARHQLDLQQRIQAVKDIALALDFAGKKGYVHRDVKPENIMLHAEDGRALLMDFGIARPTEVSMGMTQTGTAIGTPHYMSPEQARGKAVDGRADLYSLGVVLYLLLAGEVPFDADSAVAIGIKHVSEPIPRLPQELQIFQPLINTCLSKDPDHRYQSGNELIAALDALDKDQLASAAEVIKVRVESFQPSVDTRATTLPNPVRTPSVKQVTTGDKTQAISADLDDRVDTIIETGRTPLWSWLAAAGVAVAVVGAVAYHQKLPEHSRLALTPDADVELRKAELRQVEFRKAEFRIESTEDKPLIDLHPSNPASPASSGDINKTSTDVAVVVEPPAKAATLDVELDVLAQQRETLSDDLSLAPRMADNYRQLLGRYPQNTEVREGLKSLRDFFRREVAQTLERRDVERAQLLLDTASQAFPGLTQDQRFERLQARLHKTQKMQRQLQEAQAALAADKLSEAFSAYQKARTLDSTHPELDKGIESIAKRYSAMAEKWLEQGQWRKAAQAVEKGLALSPNNIALKQFARDVDALRRLDESLALAQKYQRAGKLITPVSGNAVAQYRQVLSQQANHPVALRELGAIERQQIALVQSAQVSGELDLASRLVAESLEVFPQSARLLSLQQDINKSIADAYAATQPRVPKILVSNSSLSSIVDQAQPSLQVDRVIHVGFQFENFAADSSVVQAILFDGSRSLQIAQVPVIISRQDGVHFFRIERPVEGFGDGGYSIDLVLGEKRLTSTTFEVKNNASF
jgi:serine/threonine protein kinase